MASLFSKIQNVAHNAVDGFLEKAQIDAEIKIHRQSLASELGSTTDVSTRPA